MKCDDQLLIGILDDRLEPTHSDTVTEHVSSCTRCQQRLTQLAADGDSWRDAAVALGDVNEPMTSSVVIAIDRELADDMPVQADRISLDFLDSPSHPEMLGRIGRYDIERFVGAGGMGIVFKAYDTELHRSVAVKVLAPHLAHSGGARQRFAREAQSAAAVMHENVVPIHNVDTAGKLPFLVMQFVAGESLQARVDRLGALSVTEVLRQGVQIATGLSAAHAQGLVHRDVKPGNILLEEHVDRVLISDFGLARAADDASATRSGVIAGTPHYMSPEQARGEVVDCRSDLFSLGSVLYFMCTGRPPFRANGAMAVLNRICHDVHRPVDEVNEQVSGGLADLIDCLLNKDPAQRPDSAEAVVESLRGQLKESRSYRRDRKRKISLRGKLGAVIAGLVVLGVIGKLGVDKWILTNAQPVESTPDRGATTEDNAAANEGPPVAILADEPGQAITPAVTEVEEDRTRVAGEPPVGDSVLELNEDDRFFEELRRIEAKVIELESD